jgi:hypothetical protein
LRQLHCAGLLAGGLACGCCRSARCVCCARDPVSAGRLPGLAARRAARLGALAEYCDANPM